MNIRRVAACTAVAGAVLTGVTFANAASGTGSAGSNYNPVASARVLDTRTGTGAVKGAVPSGGTLTLTVGGVDSVPADATAVTLNLTMTNATGGGYLFAYPDGPRPATGSTLNFGKGQTLANEITVPVTGGKLDIYNGSTGSVDILADLEGYYTSAPAAYTPPQTSWTAATVLTDHPDSGSGGTWAVDSINRTVTLTLRGSAPITSCGNNDAATACYLYDAVIADSGTFTTASSADVTTDGKSPNAGTAINGTVEGSLTGGTPVEFYASSASPSASNVPASVTGPVSGKETTTNWVEQFFPKGTLFSDPELLQWSWTYSAPNTCEQWADTWNGQTGDITGVNACKA